MTFEDVFPYAKEGYPIRRKAWGKAYIKMFEYDSGEREFITMFGNPVKLNVALFIDDWEIVDDSKKPR